ncbi:MAG: transporter substrate-binding domain-containing protein [Oscillospiraceae bacterium]
MKKWIAMLLAALMVFSMAACAAKNEPAADQTNDQPAADTQTSEPAEDTASGEDAAPAADQTAADSDMAYVQSKGTLVVGITDFAPMDYQNESGEWIGFDADMAKAFAESLGVSVEFVEIDWDNKILELGSKSIDCVWNGMTLTDEVTSAMSCSNAYCNNSQVVIVPADKAADYADVEACKALSFAVEAGSAGMAEVEKLGASFTEVKDQATALMEVAAGTSDAAVIDSLMAGAMVGEGTSYDSLTYTVSLNAEEGEQYGVGFRQGSDLAAALNDFFAAAYADGSMQACAETYGIQAALIAQ